MNILLWVVFGLFSGIIANWLDPKKSLTNMWSSIASGILGAVLGGLIANVVLQVQLTGFNFMAFIVAGVGASLMLIINNSLQKNK